MFVALTSGQSRDYRLRMAKETAIYVLAIMLFPCSPAAPCWPSSGWRWGICRSPVA